MNQAIDLDFIQPSIFSLARFAWLRLAALTIGLVAAAVTWQTYQNRQADLSQLNAELGQLNQVKKNQPVAKQVTVSITPEKFKTLQESMTTLAMPWGALFEAIEATQNKDVSLLSLEPNTKKQQVLITGEAKNLQVALQYVAQLQKQPVLAQVFLLKHSLDESNVSKPVNFSILAIWVMLSK